MQASGKISLSAEEWLMSLSPHRATFSIAVTAYPLINLDKPQTLSVNSGFLLCGMEDDPVWPFPLWEGYDSNLEGAVSDIKNEGTGRAGHIEAALFLQRFIDKKVN